MNKGELDYVRNWLIDNPEELESFTIDTERTNGYSYKITISREKTSEGGANNG